MFSQRTAVTSPLDPAAYRDESHFRSEQDSLFSRGWHLVAILEDLDRAGSFVSTQVGATPILLRNESGTLLAFVNVCPHRSSLLEPPGCGHRDVLRCQYHGWQFRPDGSLGKLPDGRSFRGFRAESARLRTLRLETLGSLVFVSLDDAPTSLADHLAELGPDLRSFYGRPLERAFSVAIDVPVNWKVIVENAVESYHVPMVHSETFGTYRAPELHDHLLAPTFTRYADREPWNTSPRGRAFDLLGRTLLPVGSRRRNSHAHLFPSSLVYYGDLYCDVRLLRPIGPRLTRHEVHAFVPKSLRTRALRPLLAAWKQIVRREIPRISAEDERLWIDVQRGLDSPHARRATLSAREERVTAFQRWVSERLRA